MLKSELLAVLCLTLLLTLGCDAGDENGTLGGFRVDIDASTPFTPDSSITTPEPDGGGGPPDDADATSDTNLGTPDALPEDIMPGEGADMESVRPGCDDFSDDHLYQQTAESFADYELQSMCDYRGRILFIANTAALCGLTPQYSGLQALHEEYESQGLTVLGFLSNDFGQQGGSTEQVEMCNSNYRIGFEQFTTVGVLASSRQGQHPIFRWLTSQSGMEGEVDWNFGKFLVSEDGRLLARWPSFVEPQNRMVTAAIERALNNARVAE